MADRRIIVKLCSKKMNFEAIAASDPLNEISVSLVTETDTFFPYEENTKAVAIVPLKHVPASGVNDCEVPDSTIQIPLMASGMSDTDIIDCLWGDQAELTWERGITYNVPNSFITLKWSNPQDNCAGCFWKATYVGGKNPYDLNPIYPYSVQSFRTPVLGEIPQEGVEDDPETAIDETSYWMSDVSATGEYEETQPNFCPGEEIVLYWEMKINDQVFSALMQNVWFNTPLITGGKIISKSDENLVTQTWTVEALGQTITGVMPTDFANYDIGSWVNLLRQGGQGNIFQRDSVISSADDISQIIRAVPLDFSGGLTRVKPSGDLETKDFDLKSDFKDFEICYHTGVITSIDKDAGIADVTVTIQTPEGSIEQDFSDVAIFYHCQNSEDTDGGANAFEEEDSVLILNENTDGSSISASDLSIIGFTDKLGLCLTHFLRINSTIDNTCIIIDLTEMAIATTIPLNEGGIATFPVLASSISEWLVQFSSRSTKPVIMNYTILNPVAPSFSGECIDGPNATYLQNDPGKVCIEWETIKECSLSQTVNGVSRNATEDSIKTEYQSSAQDYFFSEIEGNYFYPFGLRDITYKTNTFAVSTININDSIIETGKNTFRRIGTHTEETQNGPQTGFVDPCWGADWIGSKITSEHIYYYDFSTPFENGSNPTFNLNNEYLYWDSNNVSSIKQVLQESVCTNEKVVGGVVGSIETETPYMVSWYYWNLETDSKYGECETLAPWSTPCTITYPTPTVTERVDEVKAFFGKTIGDPKDLNPFELEESIVITEAIETLLDGDVTYTSCSYVTMEILY